MARLFSLFLLLVFSGPVLSQDPWPAKPIRWIVPYAAGGFADIRARKIGIDLAAPDGYTIGMGNLAAL